MPNYLSAQRIEIAGISRGMSHPEVWAQLADTIRWQKPYEPYDLEESYLPMVEDSSDLGRLRAGSVFIWMNRGKVTDVTVRIQNSGRAAVAQMPILVRSVWSLCKAWSHNAIGTTTEPKVPDAETLYAWEGNDNDKVKLGIWTKGDDQLNLWLESTGVGSYQITLVLSQKGR